MPVLTVREIYDTARAAGFDEREAVTWTALALRASGGRTDAGAEDGQGIGLWKIDALDGTSAGQWGDLHDPLNNARAAYEISRHGTDLSAWATTQAVATNSADFQRSVAQVQQELGTGAVSSGTPASPGGAEAASTSYEIDQGAGIGKAPSPWTATGAPAGNQPRPGDADGDGLSDVFERLIGSDPNKADTDGDGLADGYEAYVSGTDPLSVDTDHDGTTDGYEVIQHSDPLRLGPGGAEVPRWTIGAGYQRHLAQVQAQGQTQLPTQAAPPPVTSDPSVSTAPAVPPTATTPAPNLNGGRVTATSAEPRLVASLDAAGHGNWQGAVKSGNQWFLVEAGPGDRYQIFHRLNSNGQEIDQMKVMGAAHATSFAVVGNTVYATYNGEVVTFPYQGGATTSADDRVPTGWRGQISIDPTQHYAVIRKGTHYRAYDLATHQQIGQEVVTAAGQRQGFSIVGDSLYVLTGRTNAAARVDSYSFATGQHTGSQDVTGVGPGRHREPEGMFGDLMGVKTGVGNARRLNIYQLDTGIAPASAYMPEGTSSSVIPANGSASTLGGSLGGATASTTPTTQAAPVVPATESADAAPLGTAGSAGAPPQSSGGSDLDHVKFGGETVDRRTASMLTEAQRIANLKDPTIGKFHLAQGCFCHSVAASAGTHDGPGAFDMMASGYSASQKKVIGLALREVGFASWQRLPSQGPWEEHWHGIAIGTKGLPSIAAGQVKSYYAGGNGLRGNGRDDQPRPDKIMTWEEYQQAHLTSDQPTQSLADSVQPTAPASGDQFDIDGGQLLNNGGQLLNNGQALNPDVDTDHDGLSDAFERLAGTDPNKADTDGDGLSDSYEIFTSKTDPLLADSDLDGVTDSAELSLGSDPLGSGPGPGAGVGTPGSAGGMGAGGAGGLPSGAAGAGSVASSGGVGGGVGAGGVGAGAGPLGANSFGTNSLGANSVGGNPFGGSSLGANSVGGNAVGASPLGSDPLGQELAANPLLQSNPAGTLADPSAPGQETWEPLGS